MCNANSFPPACNSPPLHPIQEGAVSSTSAYDILNEGIHVHVKIPKLYWKLDLWVNPHGLQALVHGYVVVDSISKFDLLHNATKTTQTMRPKSHNKYVHYITRITYS